MLRIYSRLRVECPGVKVECPGVKVECSRFKVQGSMIHVQGSFKVQGRSRFTVDGSGVKAEPSNDSGAYGEGSRFKVDGSGVKIEACIDMVMCTNK